MKHDIMLVSMTSSYGHDISSCAQNTYLALELYVDNIVAIMLSYLFFNIADNLSLVNASIIIIMPFMLSTVKNPQYLIVFILYQCHSSIAIYVYHMNIPKDN